MRRFLISLAAAAALSAGTVAPAMAAGSSDDRPSEREHPQYDRGVNAAESGQYQVAEQIFRAIVQDEPDNADAWNYLGYSLRNQQQFEEAEQAYFRALELDSRHKGATEYLGELYVQTGRMDKANEMLERLRQICIFGCREVEQLKAAIAGGTSQVMTW